MLDDTPEFSPVFMNPVTGKRKEIECVRVDGAADEGPSHEEVQFYWTSRHYEKGYVATLVSARSSGSSFMNRVELQNGCLALGHSNNVFIPSTLAGSNLDPNTGKLHKENYSKNMELATEAYINRVNHSPCGETVIQLYKGADSSTKQHMRTYLLQYLKGSKEQKEALKREQREYYDYFDMIWNLRNQHMVKDIPLQYLFFLKCCFQPNCCHPVCKSPVALPCWYEGGPRVSYLPLPIPRQTMGQNGLSRVYRQM
jgi:hypothetical protein